MDVGAFDRRESRRLRPVAHRYTAPFGLSMNLQLGAQYVAMRAKAEGSNNTSSSDAQASFTPLLNANLGWAF
jgi:hypothetical protein